MAASYPFTMDDIATIDYIVSIRSDISVFQPVTPRARAAFAALPLNELGAYQSTDEADTDALFERMDKLGLNDFTMG